MQSVRNSKIISLSIQPETYKKVNAYCSERGCSRSWFINKAVERYLDECIEDQIDYKIAVAAWTEFKKSGEKGYSSEEVFAEAGL